MKSIILGMPLAPKAVLAADSPVSLRQRAFELWQLPDAARKAQLTRALWDAKDAHALSPQLAVDALAASMAPGRPERPDLVPPKDVPSRTPFTLEGRAALLHAIAHIEFNAINLALDAVWRFDAMPEAFYLDWLGVAAEEALHFTLLREHLLTLGHDYGDFDAHAGLWLMTQRTAGNVVARMALVPRTLEARGLDATPPLQDKFARAGDARAVEILAMILRDEIGHVAIGNRWYRWLCERDGLDAVAHYRWLTERYQAPRLRPPFNTAARLAAGFTEEELAALQ